MIGAPARLQVVAQFFGIITGSLVGSIVYLRLIPDPAEMLLTEEWPAPAVATWKVVAEALWPQPGAVPYRQDIDCIGNFISHDVRFVNYQFTSAFNPACVRIGG